MSKASEILGMVEAKDYVYDPKNITSTELMNGFLFDKGKVVNKNKQAIFKAVEAIKKDYDVYIKKHPVLSSIQLDNVKKQAGVGFAISQILQDLYLTTSI